MITIDELKMQLGGYETAVADLGEALAISASKKRVAELENKMTMPGSTTIPRPARRCLPR